MSKKKLLKTLIIVVLVLAVFATISFAWYQYRKAKTLLFCDETTTGHQVKIYEIGRQYFLTSRHFFRLEVDGEEILNFQVDDDYLQSNRLLPKEYLTSYLDNSDYYAFYFYIPAKYSDEKVAFAFIFNADFTRLEYCNCHKIESLVENLEIVTFDRDSTLVSPDLPLDWHPLW